MPNRSTVARLLRLPTLVLAVAPYVVSADGLIPFKHGRLSGSVVTLWRGHGWMGLN